MSPRSAMAWSSTGPWNANDSVTSPPSPFASTVASSWPRKQTLPSSPKRTMSPGASFFAGRTKARQREPSIRSVQGRLDLAASASRPMRRPISRAGMTLRVVDDERVAGAQQVRQVARRCGRRARAARPHHQQPRASRGTAGRSAMRSAGRSKSNRSVRIDAAGASKRAGCDWRCIEALLRSLGAPSSP